MGKKNRLNHFEFRSRDQAKLRAFYGAAFGWKWKPFNDSYTMIDFGNDQVMGGLGGLTTGGSGEPPLPAGITAFFTVEDLAAAEGKIKDAGGRVLISKQQAGEGWATYFADPDGNTMGIWQALPKKDRKEKKKHDKEKKSVVELKGDSPKAPEAEAAKSDKKDKKKKDKEGKKEKSDNKKDKPSAAAAEKPGHEFKQHESKKVDPL